MYKPNGLTSSHGILIVTADIASEAKAYSNYIKNYESETMKFFEFENNSGTRLNQMARPDQDISRINFESRINPESRISPDSRINSQIQINSPIRPTFNIPLTQLMENIQPKRPTDYELLTGPTDSELITRPTESSEKNGKEHEPEANLDPEPSSSYSSKTSSLDSRVKKKKRKNMKSVVIIGKMNHQTYLQAKTLILPMTVIT